jgi:hypothetical protein
MKDMYAVSEEKIREVIEKDGMSPFFVIKIAMSYLRNPTEPSKEDKIKLMEIMDIL